MGQIGTFVICIRVILELPWGRLYPFGEYPLLHIHPIPQSEAINNSTKTVRLILTQFNGLKCAHLYKCIGQGEIAQ